ncbi:hypothetical protein [Paenibacillus glycanilyticus]|uniref:hypothetical protein n=1 Tax=Paenibacillus glycanilyticus TaxID=126569 RepID=UPI0019100B90|nr:hypothetical protein [Paenibacillus glycanilyticus]
MKKVIIGFQDTAGKKRYYVGDEYAGKDAKRIKELEEAGLISDVEEAPAVDKQAE